MKLNLLVCSVLAAGSLMTPRLHAQDIPLTDVADNVAYSYLSAGAAYDGPYGGVFLATGDLNASPTDVQTFFKFDISGDAGKTISNATLNLYEFSVYPNTFEVDLANADFGSGAFPIDASPLPPGLTLVSTLTTAGPTFTANGTEDSLDVTSLVQSAINSGYSYVTFRLYDVTTDSQLGPSSGNSEASLFGAVNGTAYQLTAPDLDITVAPEPSTTALLLAALTTCVGISILRRRSQA